MKRVLSLLCVLVLMVSLLAGCGAMGKKESTAASPRDQNQAMTDMKSDGAAANANGAKVGSTESEKQKSSAEKPATGEGATAVAGTGTANIPTANAILAQRKIIRNANLSVEVEDFEKAYGQIKTLIAAFGYVQESNIKREKIYVDSSEKYITKGIIVIRVDKDRFESVLSDVKGLGLLLDETIKGDDVTDQYFDKESMLRLLNYEQSRLEQYLLKVTDPDTIFKTESQLTKIRHDIESLTGTLKKWDDLVALSTITINLAEKRPDAAKVQPTEKSYWTKLAEGFIGSTKGVVHFFGGLLIFLAQALPVLVLLVLVAWIVLWVYRKFFRNTLKETKKDTEV